MPELGFKSNCWPQSLCISLSYTLSMIEGHLVLATQKDGQIILLTIMSPENKMVFIIKC